MLTILFLEQLPQFVSLSLSPHNVKCKEIQIETNAFGVSLLAESVAREYEMTWESCQDSDEVIGRIRGSWQLGGLQGQRDASDYLYILPDTMYYDQLRNT